MKLTSLILSLLFALCSCSPAPKEAESDLPSEEEMDRQVEQQLEEDQERYDSMKKELGL